MSINYRHVPNKEWEFRVEEGESMEQDKVCMTGG